MCSFTSIDYVSVTATCTISNTENYFTLDNALDEAYTYSSDNSNLIKFTIANIKLPPSTGPSNGIKFEFYTSSAVFPGQYYFLVDQETLSNLFTTTPGYMLSGSVLSTNY